MKNTTILLIAATLTVTVSGLAGFGVQTLDAQEPTMTVYRNPACGCCERWAAAMGEVGVKVEVVDVQNLGQFKREYGIPERLYSCHTAVIGEHLVEGHVPPGLVMRLLSDFSEYRGMAVGGMPRGSAGMEGPVQDSYEVVGFQRNGELTVLARR